MRRIYDLDRTLATAFTTEAAYIAEKRQLAIEKLGLRWLGHPSRRVKKEGGR